MRRKATGPGIALVAFVSLALGDRRCNTRFRARPNRELPGGPTTGASRYFV